VAAQDRLDAIAAAAEVGYMFTGTGERREGRLPCRSVRVRSHPVRAGDGRSRLSAADEPRNLVDDRQRRAFGTDDLSFSACSFTLPFGSTCTDPVPTLRSYASFTQAADENALSRILIGIHFRLAVEEGTAHGRKIAKHAVHLFLRPVH
jgi:hypothetical protein